VAAHADVAAVTAGAQLGGHGQELRGPHLERQRDTHEKGVERRTTIDDLVDRASSLKGTSSARKPAFSTAAAR
jgi:hypothetical protein